jgi:hypothetical protein
VGAVAGGSCDGVGGAGGLEETVYDAAGRRGWELADGVRWEGQFISMVVVGRVEDGRLSKPILCMTLIHRSMMAFLRTRSEPRTQ